MVNKGLQSANVTRGEDKTKPKTGLQKGKRGGKRQGAGAKRKDVHKHSIVMRVPDALHEAVKGMIRQHNEGNDVISPNIPTRTIAEHTQSKAIEDETLLTYSCGCINDNGIVRRLRPCAMPMAKHTVKP